MRKILLGLTFFLSVIATNAFATLPAVNVSPNEQWRVEQNNSNPANTRTQLGTRLEGPLNIGQTVVSTSDAVGTTCGNSSTNTAAITPHTKAYVKTITSGAHGDAVCLGDGYPGESQSFVLVSTTGSQKLTVTPRTKTGFANVQLTAANASVQLTYSDNSVAGDTGGWIVTGTTPTGVTIN